MKPLPTRPWILVRGILYSLTLCLVAEAQVGNRVAAWGNPSRIVGSTNLIAIAGGYSASLGIQADGTVIAWGENWYGQTNVPPGLSGVTAIASGYSMSLALKADGTVVAWGLNTNLPANLSNVVAVSTGWNHGLALKADGTVVAWGDNSYGQTDVPADLTNATAIAAGGYHNLALKADGGLVAWGRTTSGQTSVPSEATNVVAIAAGVNHNLTLRADGAVLAWGSNASGECNVPQGLSGVRSLAAGGIHSLALQADGTVVAWGYNWYGQTRIPHGLAGARAIAAGSAHSLALVTEGPVQIVQQPVSQTVPWGAQVVFSVAAQGYPPVTSQWCRNGYPMKDGTNITGVATDQLSLTNVRFGTAGTYSVIVSNAFGCLESALAVLDVAGPPVITKITGPTNAQAGENVNMYVYAEGRGQLEYQWRLQGEDLPGATSSFLVLTNVQSSASGPYTVEVTSQGESTLSTEMLLTVTERAPYQVGSLTNRMATAGGSAILAPVVRGSLPMNFQWHFNGVELLGATQANLMLGPLRYDQEGYYHLVARNALGEVKTEKALLSVGQVAVWRFSNTGVVPTIVPAGLNQVTAVSAGARHVIALKADRTLSAWGTSGAAASVTSIPSDAIPAAAAVAGYSYNLGLKTDSTIAAWGGAGSQAVTNVPVGLADVTDIATSIDRYGGNCLAVKSDGTVVGWGVPTRPVPGGLSNVVAVSVEQSRRVALMADGTVAAWVYTNTTPRSLTNVIAVSSGRATSLMLLEDGTVGTWNSTNSYRHYREAITNVVAVAAGGNWFAAILANGTVKTWASETYIPMTDLVGVSNAVALAIGGSDADPTFLVVAVGDGSPFLTLQPKSQRALRGANRRLHARASGLQPMTYQWQFNGRDLPGATASTLALTNLDATQDGLYQVVVANTLGATTSAVANLTIVVPLAEALDATHLAWSGNADQSPWWGQVRDSHDGADAARSARIGAGKQTTLTTSVVGPGTLRFWWRVSSESGFDRLTFSLDAQATPLAEISGDAVWEERTIIIPAGAHGLHWTYSKDATVNAGADAAWVDDVRFHKVLTPLRLSMPIFIDGGGLTFLSSDKEGGALAAELGDFLEVQASTNLVDWSPLQVVRFFNNGAFLMRDLQPSNFPVRFYRVLERPQ